MEVPTLSSPGTTKMKTREKHILELPEELTEMLLLQVKIAGPSKDFWNCLKTCRDWHRIGLGIHGELDHTVATIVESYQRRPGQPQEHVDSNFDHRTDFDLGGPSPLYISELRSLTVHVRHARIAAPFAPIPGRDLFESISDMFQGMRKLTTFSLKFACDGWDFPHGDVPAIPQSKLARLVANLPSTVVNLEIDTAGVDVPPGADLVASDERHLCFQLGKAIGRLRHLRLRLGHVCGHILHAEQNPPIIGDTAVEHGVDGFVLPKTSTARSLETFTLWIPNTGDTEAIDLLWSGKRPMSLKNALMTIIRQEPILTRPTAVDRHRSPGSLVWKARYSHRGESSIERSVQVHTVNKVHSAMLPPNPLRHCAEHDILTTTSRRQFQVGGDVYPKSDFPYIAEWILESRSRWAQAGHLGARYPAPEAERADKPFWRKPTLWHPPTLMEYIEYKDVSVKEGTGLWACLLPGCPARCESLNHLRGHQLYAHPTSVRHTFPSQICVVEFAWEALEETN